jgi:hypothetical protein
MKSDLRQAFDGTEFAIRHQNLDAGGVFGGQHLVKELPLCTTVDEEVPDEVLDLRDALCFSCCW